MLRQRARTSMRDVAAAAGVSLSTVSRSLNGHTGISETVRERVLGAASSLGYTLPAATPAVDQRLRQVAFVCRPSIDPSNPFYSHVLAGAEAECRKRGLPLLYVTAVNGEPGIDLSAPGTGLLLVGHLKLDFAAWRERYKGPQVSVHNCPEGLAIDAVLSADAEGTNKAVRHLAGRGHRTIGFLGRNHYYTVSTRFRGYREALLDLSLPFDPLLVREGPVTPEGGYRALMELWAAPLPTMPTAVVCANDGVAVGALQAAGALGLRVPEDLAVVGFDDIGLAQHVSPALTTVHVYKEELGATGVRVLLQRAAEPELPVTRTFLNVRLVVRGSA